MKNSFLLLFLLGFLYFAGFGVLAGTYIDYSNEKPVNPEPKECCIKLDANS